MESVGDHSSITNNSTTVLTLNDVRHSVCFHNSTCATVGDRYMTKVMRFVDLYLNIVFLFTLSMFTLCANMLNMMVLVKQGMRTCVSLCLFCLSSTDFFSTLFGLCAIVQNILIYLGRTPGFDPFAFYFFLVYISGIFYDVSNTLTLFLSLERCLCVCLPLKFKDIFTFRRSVAVIFCIYLLCFGLLLPHFLSSGFEMRTSGNSTVLALWLSPDRAAVDVYVDAVHSCQAAVVTTAVFVCTLLMIVSLNRSSRFQGGKGKRLHPANRRASGSQGNMLGNMLGRSSASRTQPQAEEPNFEPQTEIESGGKPAYMNEHGKGLDREGKCLDCRGKDDTTPHSDKNTHFSNYGEKDVTTAHSDKNTHSSNYGENDATTAQSGKNTQSARNLNVIKTVIVLCTICFACNLSRMVVITVTHLETRLGVGKEYENAYLILLALFYVFQLLNCSLNIFVYYRFNQSFRRALRQILCCKPDK